MSYPNTPIVFTSIQNYSDRYNYCAYGMALVDYGLVQVSQINGVGLVTSGLVWQGPEIWFYPQAVDGIATGWTAAAGYSGCAAASLITTTWSASQSFGSEFPS